MKNRGDVFDKKQTLTGTKAFPPSGGSLQQRNFKSPGLPLGLGLHHAACNVQVVQVLAPDDHFVIGGVEGL